MATDLDQVLEEELRPGERLIWSGQCMGRLRKQRKALSSREWAVGAAGLTVFGGVFVALWLNSIFPIGLAILVSPISATRAYLTEPDQMYRRSRTIYAITDRRVVAIQDLSRGRRARILPLTSVRHIQIHPTNLGIEPGPPLFKGFDALERQTAVDSSVNDTAPARTSPKGSIEFKSSPLTADEGEHCLRFVMVSKPERVVELFHEAWQENSRSAQV